MTTPEDDTRDARAYLEARGYFVLAPDTPPTVDQLADITARIATHGVARWCGIAEPLEHLTGPGDHSEKETP